MTINSIAGSHSKLNFAPVIPQINTNPVTGSAASSGSGSSASQSPGNLLAGIEQTLAQLGITSTPGSSDAASGSTGSTGTGVVAASGSSTGGVSSSLQQFTGAVFHAARGVHHGHGGHGHISTEDSNGGDSASTTGSASTSPANGYGSLSDALNALAQAVGSGTAANGQDASTGAIGTAATAATSNSSALASLQQQFSNLSGSVGGSGGTSLQSFLQTLASNIGRDLTMGASGGLVQLSA